MLEQPHLSEHEGSLSRRMERGKMPKSFEGLVRWYVTAFEHETPAKLHKAEPWHDRVTTGELEAGTQPVGGSQLGSLAYGPEFRLILEAPASMTDEDGYYLFPVRCALSIMARKRPLTVRFLLALGLASGDWQSLATALGYPDELMQTFLHASLKELWGRTYERTTLRT